VTVAAGRFAPGHLGELTQQVPFEMVDAVLEQTCRVQRRVRDLPARVVVYLLLAGCLFAELGYSRIWRKLTAGLEGLPLAVPTASAVTQARRRLGPGPLRALFDLLRGPSPADARWRGLLVCAIDGTIMSSLTARRTWPSTQNSAAAPMAAPATRSFGCWPWSAAAPEP
jgi:Insertion element 4 transposase N-terminal